jgi:hypothetical protein
MVRSRLIHALVAVALLAAPLLLFGDRALAIQDSEDKVWFGPVGLAVGDGARINVVAIGNPDIIGNPDEAPWTFVMRVFDRQGRVVQSERLDVARGVIGSFEIIGNPNERPGISALAVRRTLRAEIVGFNPQPDPPGQYMATMEIYNVLNGRTSIFIGNPDVVPAATRVGTAAQ